MVFTLPAPLRPVVFAHRRRLLDLLFRSVADTLHAFAADPRWLGAQLGRKRRAGHRPAHSRQRTEAPRS